MKLLQKFVAAATLIAMNCFAQPSLSPEPIISVGTVEWYRCQAGKVWNSGTCRGDVLQLTWIDAVAEIQKFNERSFLGKNKWRLPSASEYTQLLSHFNYRQTNEVEAKLLLAALFPNNFHGREYWSLNWLTDPLTSAEIQANSFTWRGYKNMLYRENRQYAGLRPFFMVNTENEDSGWDVAMKELEKKLAEIERETQARLTAERHYAATRKIEEDKFNGVVNSKDPQAMYLSAGTYDRSGDSDRAKRVYEAIISRFPKSGWAVKANDQLIANARSNSARSNEREAAVSAKSSRGGVRRLETVNSYGANVICNNGYEKIITRSSTGQWIDGDKDDVWRGFGSATQLAFHVCQ